MRFLIRLGRGQSLFLRIEARTEIGERLLLLGSRHVEEGLHGAVGVGQLRVQPRLLDRIEEGVEAVELLLGDRIELVVVAARAAHRQAEEDGRGRRGAVDRVLDEILLGDRAALVARHVVAVETARDLLALGRVREEVSRDLLGEEAVEGHAVAEGCEHPVPPQPHLASRVHVDAAGVGVTRGVEPRRRHALGVARAVGLFREQLVDPVRPCALRVGPFLREESIDLLRSRRESGQIEEQSADARLGVGRRTRRHALLLELREHESVDRIRGPAGVLRFRRVGNGRSNGRDEGPVRLVVRALRDPSPHDLAFVGGERPPPALRRRHAHVFVGARDAAQELAPVGTPRHDRRVTVADGGRDLREVEAQLGLTLARVGSVTPEAPIREDRADVAVVTDRLRRDTRPLRRRSEEHETCGGREESGCYRGASHGARRSVHCSSEIRWGAWCR